MRLLIVVYKAVVDKWIKVIITDRKKQERFIGSEQVCNFSSGYNFSLIFTICLSATAVQENVLWVLI